MGRHIGAKLGAVPRELYQYGEVRTGILDNLENAASGTVRAVRDIASIVVMHAADRPNDMVKVSGTYGTHRQTPNRRLTLIAAITPD